MRSKTSKFESWEQWGKFHFPFFRNHECGVDAGEDRPIDANETDVAGED